MTKNLSDILDKYREDVMLAAQGINSDNQTYKDSAINVAALSGLNTKSDIKALFKELMVEVIGEYVTQTERHWSDNRADWCGRGGTMIDTRCICDELNALKAEQLSKLDEVLEKL